MSVPYEVSQIKVTAAAEDSTAKVSVNSPTLKVNGDTNVTVTVTAQNGATKTYTIKVHRAQDPNYVPSDNARLSNLSAADYYISPLFDPDRTEYIVWLPYETTQLDISGTPEDALAQGITVKGADFLKVGDNEVLVCCTAEDGQTVKTYTITAKRGASIDNVASSNTNLSDLELSAEGANGTVISWPIDFNADTTEYSISVDALVSAITVNAPTADEAAKVTVQGANNLTPGAENDAHVIVTAENGDTKDYVIKVAREALPKNPWAFEMNTLSWLIVAGAMVMGFIIGLFIKNGFKKKSKQSK